MFLYTVQKAFWLFGKTGYKVKGKKQTLDNVNNS